MSQKLRLTTVDGIGLLVGDLDAELLLYRHNNLNGIQAIETKVVGEVGSGLDLYAIMSVQQFLTMRLLASNWVRTWTRISSTLSSPDHLNCLGPNDMS